MYWTITYFLGKNSSSDSTDLKGLNWSVGNNLTITIFTFKKNHTNACPGILGWGNNDLGCDNLLACCSSVLFESSCEADARG